MPLHPDVVAKLRAGGYDSVTIVNVRRLLEEAKTGQLDQPQPIVAPVSGKAAILLLVDFPDLTHSSASVAYSYWQMLGSIHHSYPDPGSMWDYWADARGDHVSGGVSVHLPDGNWRAVPHPHSYYANADGITGTADDYGWGEFPNNAAGLVVDAIRAVEPYASYATFARGGRIECVFVVHAGRGAETDPSHPDWVWSQQGTLGEHAITADAVEFDSYLVAPEYTILPGDSSIGVYCHEYAHVLGLSDLDDPDGSSRGLGVWSLMGSGAWNGNGTCPAMLDPWSRMQLGWFSPTELQGSPVFTGIEHSARIYPWQVEAGEYFLLEARSHNSWGAGLPAGGLVVYHVDEDAEAADDWHPQVMIEQADGLFDLQHDVNDGDAGDPFPGSTDNTAIGADTNPSFRLYSGSDPLISIDGIQFHDQTDGLAGVQCWGTSDAASPRYDFPLDAEPGWTAEGGWGFGVPTGAGSPPGPAGAHLGTNVYGYGFGGSYPNGLATTEYLTTSPIDCRGLSVVVLSFWRWLGVENSQKDHVIVEVSRNGTTWVPVWENRRLTPIQDRGWVHRSYDISAVAAGEATVQVRWGFGPTDTSGTSCGWYLDDVQILGLGPAVSPPDADFTATPRSGPPPLVVTFTDVSTGSPALWLWELGDGATSTEQNPSYEYRVAGAYTVSLTATNAYGSDTETKADYIWLGPPPEAHFVASPVAGAAPLAVTFTDLSTGNPTAWEWDFGDGATSTGNQPTHIYAEAGCYSVTLTATNPAGDVSETRSDYIAVGFTDTPADQWAFASIVACASAAIVQGYLDNSYRPADPVTRAQMAVYAARALAGGDQNVPAPTTPLPSFTDVGTGHWAYRYIEYCAGEDIVQGYPGGTYEPDVVVNRGQMAVYIARSVATPTGDAGVPEVSADTAAFSDVTAANDWSWCHRHVEYCAGLGIVQGYGDGTYRPDANVTRDQMAVYIQRAFALPVPTLTP